MSLLVSWYVTQVNTAAAQTCGFYGMCTLNTINIIVLDRGIYNAYSSLAYLRISEMTNFLSRLKSQVWEVSFLHGMLASFYTGAIIVWYTCIVLQKQE